MAWTRVWPLPGQFSPSPPSACRAWGPAPGALATAAGSLSACKSSRIPSWPRAGRHSHPAAARSPMCVPKTSSTSCDQAIFVDHVTDVSLFPYAVVVEIDRFG